MQRTEAGVAGAGCQGEKGRGGTLEGWAGPDLQEALGFMGREKGSHLEDFNQGSEFVFP